MTQQSLTPCAAVRHFVLVELLQGAPQPSILLESLPPVVKVSGEDQEEEEEGEEEKEEEIARVRDV